jgi:cation diffusion facilitator family transporter
MKIISINPATKFLNYFNRSTPLFATRVSFVICVIIAVLGILFGISEGSLTVQTNGLIAAIDVLNSLLFITAINQSIRQPDYVFNYGYGKYESLAILSSAMLLVVILVYTLIEAITDFGSPEPIRNHNLLILISGSSLISMIYMSKYLKKTAKRFNIPMLAYDSDLWKVDSYFEIGVLINLFIGKILTEIGYDYIGKIIDSGTAAFLIIVSLYVPLKHGKDALDQILDRTLPEHIQFDIIAVIAENFNRMCEFKSVHTRRSGKDIFIELDIIMPYDFSLEQIHKLEKDINSALVAKYPTSYVRLYFTPCAKDCLHYGKVTCPVKTANLTKKEKEKFDE